MRGFPVGRVPSVSSLGRGTWRGGLGTAIAALTLLLMIPRPVGGDSDGRAARIDAVVERATRWLGTIRVSPFEQGIPSLRNFTVEVETWHRLWFVEKDAARRSALDQEVRERLRLVLDETRLDRVLAGTDAAEAFTELAVLARRCTQHGMDPAPIGAALGRQIDALKAEVARVPTSLKIVYASYLPDAGIDLGLSVAGLRGAGMLAGRPREIDLTLADIYYLTHEIYAYTDYASQSLGELSHDERTYLLRVLPFYAIFYSALNNLDVASELVSCLHAAGMTDTWGYQEGIRVIVERQNPDGSFGTRDARALGRAVEPADYLHPTMNCIWALLLDRRINDG